MLLVPATKQVGAVPLIVGTAGVTNIAALLNDADELEVQDPLPAVTV